MRVERFSLFFPPLIWRRQGKGETEYAIGAIPLGGYVKISGMNPHEELPPEVAHRAYFRQPVWKRVAVIVGRPAGQHRAGVLIIITGLVLHNGEPIDGAKRATACSARSRPPACSSPATGSCPSTAHAAAPTGSRARSATHKCAGKPHRRLQGRDAGHARRRCATANAVELHAPARATTPRSSARASASRSETIRRDVGVGRASVLSVEQMGSFTGRTVTTIAQIFDAREAQADLRRGRHLRGHAPGGRVRPHAGAVPARGDLAVARRDQPVPVPAARRRPHLLGAGREGARQGDPVQRDGARRLRRLRAGDGPVLHRPDERHRPPDGDGLRACRSRFERPNGSRERRRWSAARPHRPRPAARRGAATMAEAFRITAQDHPRPRRGADQGRRGLA